MEYMWGNAGSATPLPIQQLDEHGNPKGSNANFFAVKKAGTPVRAATKVQREADIESSMAKVAKLQAKDELTDDDRHQIAECDEFIKKSREYLKMIEKVEQQLLQAKMAQWEAGHAEAELQQTEEVWRLKLEHEKKLKMQQLQDERLVQ
jgi:PDZ domain-containing secreted protein